MYKRIHSKVEKMIKKSTRQR